MAIWDSTVSSLNPYMWIKMDAGLPMYGTRTTYTQSPVEYGPGLPITFNSSGGKTGAYITFPTAAERWIQFIPQSPYLNGMNGKTFTIGLWFKKPINSIGPEANQILEITGSSVGSFDGRIGFILPGTTDANNAGKLVFNVNSTGGGTGGGIPGNLYASVDGNWHFALISINGQTVKYYYDGQNVGQSTIPTGNTRPWAWQLGAPYWEGQMDDIVYFNYVLSDQQILDLYEAAQDKAPLKYWNNSTWATPQESYLYNGQGFTPVFGKKVWDGTAWLDITP
jgi:hypothetical protein